VDFLAALDTMLAACPFVSAGAFQLLLDAAQWGSEVNIHDSV